MLFLSLCCSFLIQGPDCQIYLTEAIFYFSFTVFFSLEILTCSFLAFWFASFYFITFRLCNNSLSDIYSSLFSLHILIFISHFLYVCFIFLTVLYLNWTIGKSNWTFDPMLSNSNILWGQKVLKRRIKLWNIALISWIK